jgi:hypothetical protein
MTENKKHPLQKKSSLEQRVSYTLQLRLSSIQSAGEARQGNKLVHNTLSNQNKLKKKVIILNRLFYYSLLIGM